MRAAGGITVTGRSKLLARTGQSWETSRNLWGAGGGV